MLDDPYGLDREEKIKKSGVRSIFTPHHPVNMVQLLCGRQGELQKIIQTINTPGHHVLLFGERGVGKSSLAIIASVLIEENGINDSVIIKRCDSSDDYESIMRFLLQKLGIEIAKGTTRSHSEGLSAQANAGFAKGGGHSTRSTTDTFREKTRLPSPSEVVDLIKDMKKLFIIDEADSIRIDDDKKKIAETIKILSDNNSKFKIIVVGISETGIDLFGGHPSVERCIEEVFLERMKPIELREIVEKGAVNLTLAFEKVVIDRIIDISDGYPHYTHLLSLKAAENAIVVERKSIGITHLNQALQDAAGGLDNTLRRKFDAEIRGGNSNMKRAILLGAARCAMHSREIKSADLRSQISEITNTEISQGQLNNYLSRLISDDLSTVLRRLAKGVYCFNDPRMPSFVRIACQDI